MAEDDPTPGFECIDKAMLRARRQVVLMSRRHRAVLCLAVTAAAWLLFSAPSYLFGRRCSRSMPRIFSHRGFDASEALYEVTSQRSLRDLLDGGLRSFDLDLFWTAHDPEGTPHPTPNPRHGWPPLPPHAPGPDLVSGRHNVRGPPAHSAAAVAPACRPRAHATRGAALAPRGEAPLAARAAPPPQATTARARPGPGALSFGLWGLGRGACVCADRSRGRVCVCRSLYPSPYPYPYVCRSHSSSSTPSTPSGRCSSPASTPCSRPRASRTSSPSSPRTARRRASTWRRSGSTACASACSSCTGMSTHRAAPTACRTSTAGALHPPHASSTRT